MHDIEENTEPDDTLPQGDLKSVSALKAWLVHSEFGKRVAAAEQLGVLEKRASDAEGALEEALGDDAGTVRVAAALALWKVTGRSKATLAALRDLLMRGSGALRIEAAWALGSLGKAAEPAAGDLVMVVAGTVATSDDGIDYSDGAVVFEPGYLNTSERSAAAEALGQVGVKSVGVLAALRGLAKNGETYEKDVAAEALKLLDGK